MIDAISFAEDTIEVERDQAERLAARFRPDIYLHRLSPYFPIDVDAYMMHCDPPLWELQVQGGRLKPNVELLAHKQVTGRLSKVVHTLSRVHTATGRTITYFISLYSFQPDAKVCFCIPFSGSAHVADVEFVAVLAEADGTRVATFYSAHGSTESQWVRAEAGVTTSPVYVALDTHANYPTPGLKFRFWGFNIELADGGAQPLDYEVKVLDADHPWRHFQGSMGPDGIASLGNDGRLNLPGEATHSSATAARRRFTRTS